MRKITGSKKLLVFLSATILGICTIAVVASKIPDIELKIKDFSFSSDMKDMKDIKNLEPMELPEILVSEEEVEKQKEEAKEYYKKIQRDKELINKLESEKRTEKQELNQSINSGNSNKVIENSKSIEKAPSDKEEKIELLRDKHKKFHGNFERLTKDIDKNKERISLSRAKKIIKNNDFDTAIQKINDVNQYPDYVGGSGVDIKEYWLDEEGMEKLIFIIQTKNIVYERLNVNFEKENSEILKD